ncbi:MAG: sulfatase [Chloroflexi bacterium]|nr:sulfatase [Chloroflexota bacterium]
MSRSGSTKRPLPNLLLVFADQMRGMDMGCAGNPDVRTPAMDRLAKQGVRLTRCFATSPVCSPNRAILLTGTYPTTNRVPGNDLPLPSHLPSLGTIARDHGYRTAYIGKWHLDGVPRTKFTPPGPRRSGFDFWAAYNCTHDYFHPKYYRDTPQVVEVDGYEPEVQTDLALAFLDEQRDAAEPFCLVLSWGPPHDPYDQVPETYRAMYDPTALTLRPNAQPDADNPLAAGLDCRRTIADYYAAITALDDQLARLLDRLDALGLAEDTIVVFTSDHGDMLWSHGWMKKQAPYEESISVPFLIRWPGVLPAGRVCDALVGTVDILPTLAGLMGWDLPSGQEGQDLSAALLGQAGAPSPESVLIANYICFDEAKRQHMTEWRGVRTRRYTYVERPGRIPWLLFDNEADPYQTRNLVNHPDYRHVADELRQQLSAWLERTHDPFLPGPQLIEHLGLTEVWLERERYMAS